MLDCLCFLRRGVFWFVDGDQTKKQSSAKPNDLDQPTHMLLFTLDILDVKLTVVLHRAHLTVPQQTADVNVLCFLSPEPHSFPNLHQSEVTAGSFTFKSSQFTTTVHRLNSHSSL